MPDTTTQAGVVLATIVAGVALASGLRKSWRRGEASVGALIGAAVVITTFSFVQVLATFLDSWVAVTDVYQNVSYVAPEWGQNYLRATAVFLAGGCFALFVTGMRKRSALVNVPALLLVLVLLTSMASALLHGDFPLRVYSLIQLCILLACVFAPRGLSVHLGIGTVCMVAAIASGIALIAYQDFSVIECVPGHKCGILGFNFRGVLDNENAFAMYLALAMPFVYISFRGWEGWVMSLYMTAMLLLTGSRSGALAAVVTFAVLVAVRPDIRRPRRTPVRSAVLSFGLLLTFMVGFLLPLVVQEQSAFSGRASLWQLARTALSDPANLVFGTGMFGWDRFREAGLIDSSAVYSVHNQWLHVLFSTGLIGLSFFVAGIAILLWQARNGYYAVAACVLVPFFVLSVTERPWPIDTADWLTWTVTGALLCYPVMRGNPLQDKPGSEQPDRRMSAPSGARVSGPRSEKCHEAVC